MLHEWAQSALRTAAEGGPMVFVAMAFATLLSEDLTCIAAGLLVAHGAVSFAPAVVACYIGILSGDMLLVLIGRTLGRQSLQMAPLRWWASPTLVARAEHWFLRRGPVLIFASRFMPGTRVPAYFAAGALRAPMTKFAGWFALACAIWTPLLVGGAVIFGEAALRLFASWASVAPALLVAGVAAWLAAKAVVNLGTWRGRRFALGRWRRITRWEFWPTWAIHAPLTPYLLWLGIRHRGLTLFTAVNPGIDLRGETIGESKSQILRGLADADEMVAPWQLIPRGTLPERVTAVRSFMTGARLDFPIVLKPDIGQRGASVVIAHDAAAIERALNATPAPLIAQAYVSGLEFDVLYVRLPHEPRGRILALTGKRPLVITGDGKRSIEELILADDRAVCRAPYFTEQLGARADEHLGVGETLNLTELGTHARGMIFVDATKHLTPALDAAIERVSRSFAGFHLGRFDVRAQSVESFQRGDFKIIELNGLTSEPAHIYDPERSLWSAWRLLRTPWRLAFEIAAVHRARGVKPLTLRETWMLMVRRPTAR